MFFEMNLSCHPPVINESEHKTDREGRKLSLESISGGYSMNLFQNVKYGVSCREAVERYGVPLDAEKRRDLHGHTVLCPTARLIVTYDC